MDTEVILKLLKMDLGIRNDKKDEYLINLIKRAEEMMRREGVKPELSNEYSGLVQSYAAYLFRTRASDNTKMPRFLRFGINNLLMSQKGRAYDTDV